MYDPLYASFLKPQDRLQISACVAGVHITVYLFTCILGRVGHSERVHLALAIIHCDRLQGKPKWGTNIETQGSMTSSGAYKLHYTLASPALNQVLISPTSLRF